MVKYRVGDKVLISIYIDDPGDVGMDNIPAIITSGPNTHSAGRIWYSIKPSIHNCRPYAWHNEIKPTFCLKAKAL